MGVLAICPRTSKVLPYYAYFLFSGLSNTDVACRAISLSRNPTRLTPNNGLLRGWIHPMYTSSGYKCGATRRMTTFGSYATSKTEEECTTSIHETPIASTKWEFNPNRETITDGNAIRNMLVCGDGDLSYSAEMSPELDRLGIQLFATVLEDEDTHNEVYQFSESNTNKIDSFPGHKTVFGVNATTLSTYFGGDDDDESAILFDRIQFNFPHWRGKANNRYNRQLLSEFLESAATVLDKEGEIHVALCDGQGGCSAKTIQEWKGSWTASKFAAENGLLLARVFPYEAQYRLSSHRGVDRPFKLGNTPLMHVFVKPDGLVTVPRDIQLCCRHELHIVIPDDDGASAVCSLDQILAGDAMESIIQGIVPAGVRVEVPARKILDVHGSHGIDRIGVFLVVYCSEQYPVTRDMADQYREMAECEVSKYVPLRENRRGRTVSHPFPYPALHPEIKYRTSGSKGGSTNETNS